MMPLLYRLRRSVALFVCPELSAEARVKATLAEARKMRAPAKCAGFIDVDLAKEVAAKEPFLRVEDMQDLLGTLRDSRVERAKKVLQIIHLVQKGRMAEKPDLLLDSAAQELSVVLFGEA